MALFAGASGLPASYPLAPGNLLSAFWPVAIAGIIFTLARLARLRAPGISEGDLIAPVVAAGGRVLSMFPAPPRWIGAARIPGKHIALDRTADKWAQRSEQMLSRWSIAGVLLLTFVILTTL